MGCDTPLAICDCRSLLINELLPCDKVIEDYVDESYFLRYRLGHRWYWLSDQTCDEVAVFVIWDLKADKEYLGSVSRISENFHE